MKMSMTRGETVRTRSSLPTAALLCTAAAWIAAAARPLAADLHTDTVAAFDRYVRVSEARMDEELRGTAPFLWIDRLATPQRATAYGKLHRGEIIVARLQTREAGKPIDVPSGMCHHWAGTAFAEGARLEQAVALMQGYDKYVDLYKPAVRRSRILSHEDNHFRTSLQLFMKKIISVVLNTEYDVRYMPVAPNRMRVRSHATRIAEVRTPDTPEEQEKPVGHDNGFLWRFDNYFSLEERDGGVYIQCESISLSRRIPPGLGWLIGPFVTSIPRESLEFTLGRMRKALTQGFSPASEVSTFGRPPFVLVGAGL